VRFDGFLIDYLAQDVLLDLQELVFAAKPLYTAMALRPGLLFNERIRMLESNLSALSRYVLGGQAGMIVDANANYLTVGPHWTVGSWFRYVENSGTFAAPTATVTNILGAPGAGYERRPSSIYVAPDLARSGVPAPYDEPVYIDSPAIFGTNATITMSGNEATMTINDVTQLMSADMLMQYMRIGGNLYRIGQVDDDQTLVLYAPGLANGSGISWQYVNCGSARGVIAHDSQGQSFFEDLTGQVDLPGWEDTQIRVVYPVSTDREVYRMGEHYSGSITRIEKKYYLLRDGQPITGVTTATGPARFTLPTAFLWPDMCYLSRLAADPATALSKKYYIEFLTGPNAGASRQLHGFTSSTEATIVGSVTAAAGVEVTFYCLEAYDTSHAGPVGPWEHLERSVWVDTDSATPATLHLPTDVDVDGSVAYTAYGVQEPTVPFTVSFDETQGDTYYTVGGVDPHQRYMRSRTAKDMDLQESPVQITRTPFP
jgi:hypothetical protein